MDVKVEVEAEVPEAPTTILTLKTQKNIGLNFYHITRKVSTCLLKVGILEERVNAATLGKSGRQGFFFSFFLKKNI